MCRRAPPLFLAAAVASAAHAPAEDPLPPAWRHETTAAIEWIEVLPSGAAPQALLVSSGPALALLSVESGEPIWRIERETLRGARFAGAGRDYAVVHTSSHVFALDLSPAAGEPLRWEAVVGEEFTPGEPRDPEFLDRAIAALAVDDELLVLRSDGRLLYLAAADGAVTQRLRLAPARSALMLRCDPFVAAMIPSGGALRVLLLPAGSAPHGGTSFALPSGPPLVTRALDGSVLAVWTDRWGLLADGAAPRIEPLPRNCFPRAGLAALLPRSGDRSPLLVLPTAGGAAAIDVATGGVAWTSPEVQDEALRLLAGAAGRVLLGRTRSIEILDADTGATRARVTLEGAWIDGRIEGTHALAVAGVPAGPGGATEYAVTSIQLSATPAQVLSRRIRLGDGEVAVRVAFARSRVLLCGRSAIEAFQIGTDY